MKAGPDRKYMAEFRHAAVRPVLDGRRGVPQAARSPKMSDKTLAHRMGRAGGASRCRSGRRQRAVYG